jgi:hypothetical protein
VKFISLLNFTSWQELNENVLYSLIVGKCLEKNYSVCQMLRETLHMFHVAGGAFERDCVYICFVYEFLFFISTSNAF